MLKKGREEWHHVFYCIFILNMVHVRIVSEANEIEIPCSDNH